MRYAGGNVEVGSRAERFLFGRNGENIQNEFEFSMENIRRRKRGQLVFLKMV